MGHFHLTFPTGHQVPLLGIEPRRRPSQSRVQDPPHSKDIRYQYLTEESNPDLRFRRPPCCPAHSPTGMDAGWSSWVQARRLPVGPAAHQPNPEVRPGVEPGLRPYHGRVRPEHLQTFSTKVIPDGIEPSISWMSARRLCHWTTGSEYQSEES